MGERAYGKLTAATIMSISSKPKVRWRANLEASRKTTAASVRVVQVMVMILRKFALESFGLSQIAA